MFVSTLLAVAFAAPVPKAKAPELYFPTVEGTKRVMTMKTGDETSETTETVTQVAEKDGKYTVTVKREAGGRSREVKYEVSSEGLLFVSKPNTKSGEPLPLLKLSAKETHTWAVERSVPGKGAVTTYTVGKEEDVVVPAGKFQAIPVSEETKLNGDTVKSKTWFTAGVGVVKLVNNLEQVSELKEFTLPKAK